MRFSYHPSRVLLPHLRVVAPRLAPPSFFGGIICPHDVRDLVALSLIIGRPWKGAGSSGVEGRDMNTHIGTKRA